MFDEAVHLDSEPRLGTLIAAVRGNRPATAALWTVTAEEDIRQFDAIIQDLRLQALQPSRYSLRHAGASEDLLGKRRTVEEVKKRGRWVADSSLKRYGKETRLQTELNKVDPAIVNFGRQVHDNIEAVLLREVQVRAPQLPPLLLNDRRLRQRRK